MEGVSYLESGLQRTLCESNEWGLTTKSFKRLQGRSRGPNINTIERDVSTQ